MEIQMMKVGDLIPYENNPRNNDDAVESVANSIKEFGFLNPIVIDKNNVIAAGHTRLKAAKRLGMKEVPTVRAESLTDEQIKAFRLADNKTAELAGWNFKLLPEELASIDEIDMSAFGFEKVEEDNQEDESDESYSDDGIRARASFGDLWELGDHRLICGDSTDSETVERLLGGVRADMILTDLPYGMNLDTDFSCMKNHLDFAKDKGFKSGKKYQRGKVDEFHPEFIESVFALDTREMFLWGADYFAELLPNKNDGSWIVWDKRSNEDDDIASTSSSDKMFGSCFELCWSKKKHKREIARIKWAGCFGCEQEFDRKRYHPTQKPIKLSEWFLSRYSKEEDNVIDLFGGSGGTLLACENQNRDCLMCEIDPHYCDVIIDRWERLTGREARKIE